MSSAQSLETMCLAAAIIILASNVSQAANTDVKARNCSESTTSINVKTEYTVITTGDDPYRYDSVSSLAPGSEHSLKCSSSGCAEITITTNAGGSDVKKKYSHKNLYVLADGDTVSAGHNSSTCNG